MYESQIEVAFSFSGAQRELVRQVKNYLAEHEIDAFMDECYTVTIWGENLEKVFSHIYSGKAKYYVVFVSKQYTESENTFFEFSTFLKEVHKDGGSQILPVYLDDTQLKFISSIGALDARHLNYQEIGNYIISKIKGEPLRDVLNYLTARLENNYHNIFGSAEIKCEKRLDGTYLYTNPLQLERGYRILLQYYTNGQYEKIYIFDSLVPIGVLLTFPTGEVYKEHGRLVLMNYGFCYGDYKLKITKESLAEIIKNKTNQIL